MVWPSWVLKSLTMISGLWSCWELFCFASFFFFFKLLSSTNMLHTSNFFPLLSPIILRVMYYFLQLCNWTGSCSPLYDCDCFSIEIGAEAYYWGALLLSFQSVGSMLYLEYLPNVWYIFGCLQVLPENGLEVRLSGSGATGKPPTTLSPTVLIVDWRCIDSCSNTTFLINNLLNLFNFFVFFSAGEKARDTPYEVNVTIPVEGYEPIQFILTKMCGKLTLLSSWKPISLLAGFIDCLILSFKFSEKINLFIY